jgi:hypothetical protein
MTVKTTSITIAALLLLALPAHGTESELSRAPSAGRVERASFTTGVVEREPQDTLTSLGNDHVQVLYFSEIRDAEGDTVVHRWEWNGQVMAEVTFEVGGPRWRIHSSKSLDPSWLGEWTVTTVDSSGRVLQTDTFLYEETPRDSESQP